MLRIEGATKRSSEEIVNLSVAFFVNRYGLEVKTKAECCAELTGGGGGIEVNAFVEGNRTRVEIVSREWDDQAKEFIREFAK